MNDDYDALAKANDATEFAQSRFGVHYLNRLAEVRDNHYEKARGFQKKGDMNMAFAALARADETDGEIDYFRQAQEITRNPKLLKMLADGVKKLKEAGRP